MEQLNVNAVRTSHYPSDPYFYDLADKHGLWIDDEIDIETHNHENCADWCQANQPEWRPRHGPAYRPGPDAISHSRLRIREG